MNHPTQIDTAPIVATIKHLLADGAEGPAFLATVVPRFPNLTSAEAVGGLAGCAGCSRAPRDKVHLMNVRLTGVAATLHELRASHGMTP